MKAFKTLLILAAMSAGAAHAQMTMKPGDPPMAMDGKKEMTAPAGDMTEGEIRKVDLENKKITLKHGDIKNLDMPGMTMVFQVKDPAMLDKVKVGDKVGFRAEKANGALMVTEIQSAKSADATVAQSSVNSTGAAAAAGDSKKEVVAASGDMTEGEIRKVDLENKKITIKHGDIKNLEMPGMTMVFQVKDPALLGKVKTGDKIRFKAEKANGAIVVTDIQPAQ